MVGLTETGEKKVHTLDLNFLGIPGAIASYLVRHSDGAVLIESGPGSTLPGLTSELAKHHLKPADITDVLVTHIHLDHAGASGWLARQGARIHVHPAGAPHLVDPDKLLKSATRIYGDMMETLWGEVIPVPEEQVNVLQDSQIVEIGGLRFCPIDTPGHAEHHFAYLFEDICFTGDIAGVRIAGLPHLRVPMPPPEFHLEKWRESVQKLRRASFSRIAPTHFGIYSDPDWHLANLEQNLNEIEAWMERLLPADPPVEEVNTRFSDWTRQRSLADGLTSSQIDAYEAANPSSMSGYGMQRYWRKYHSVDASSPS